METSIAPVTDQRSNADWPRSIEDGSAVNSATTGLVEGAGAVLSGFVLLAGGGGGGGSGAFLPPHAVANIVRNAKREKLVSLVILTCEEVFIIARRIT